VSCFLTQGVYVRLFATRAKKEKETHRDRQIVYDVVVKTSTRRRSRITCVVVEKKYKSRRAFNKNSCDLFTPDSVLQ